MVLAIYLDRNGFGVHERLQALEKPLLLGAPAILRLAQLADRLQLGLGRGPVGRTQLAAPVAPFRSFVSWTTRGRYSTC